MFGITCSSCWWNLFKYFNSEDHVNFDELGQQFEEILAPYFLFLPLTKIDTRYDVLSKRMIPIFLEIVAEIQEAELINDKFGMDKALVAHKPSKSAKKKKKKKDKRRKEQLRKDMMKYLKENILSGAVQTSAALVDHEKIM